MLDCMHLDPLRAGPAEVAAARRLLRDEGLACAVETGARFLLDPRRKHHPGLCDPDPLQRLRRIEIDGSHAAIDSSLLSHRCL